MEKEEIERGKVEQIRSWKKLQELKEDGLGSFLSKRDGPVQPWLLDRKACRVGFLELSLGLWTKEISVDFAAAWSARSDGS